MSDEQEKLESEILMIESTLDQLKSLTNKNNEEILSIISEGEEILNSLKTQITINKWIDKSEKRIHKK